ncbi:hypothetical protein P692DRAFT_20833197, partial [Suillus brevipes Sb2]
HLLTAHLPLTILLHLHHRQILPKKRQVVLSRIRDLVSTPNFIPSSIAPVIETCITQGALSPAEFSAFLQLPFIEGHSAMYWAILNHRREVVLAFAASIPRFLLSCVVIVNDQTSFAQLNLGYVSNSTDEPLRRFLNCPPDEVQVQDTGDGLFENKFVACLRIRMFRKRLGTAQTSAIEFVAGGRIWVMILYRTPSMIGWGISLCLSRDSSPAHLLGAVLVIKVHGGESSSSCANPLQDERIRLRAPHNRKGYMLAPTNK